MKKYFVSWMEEFNATVLAENEEQAIKRSKTVPVQSRPEHRDLYDVEELEMEK